MVARPHIDATLNRINWSDAGLTRAAVNMELTQLDHVMRFGGHGIVTPHYADSTAQHVGAICADLSDLCDISLSDNTRKIAYKNTFSILGAVHDNGEIFGEPATAHSECDPDLQETLAQYNPAKMERNIALFAHQAALYCDAKGQPDAFHTFVANVRANARPQDFDPSRLTAAQALQFFSSISQGMENFKTENTDTQLWNNSKAQQENTTIAGFYDRIESPYEFVGGLGKMYEKCQGTRYANKIIAARVEKGEIEPNVMHKYSTTGLLNVACRYEKMLPQVYGFLENVQGKSERDELAKLFGAAWVLCCQTTMHSINCARDVFRVTQDSSEPDWHASADAHQSYLVHGRARQQAGDVNFSSKEALYGRYEQALNTFKKNGTVVLPTAGAGCLARSPANSITAMPLVSGSDARQIDLRLQELKL